MPTLDPNPGADCICDNLDLDCWIPPDVIGLLLLDRDLLLTLDLQGLGLADLDLWRSLDLLGERGRLRLDALGLLLRDRDLPP